MSSHPEDRIPIPCPECEHVFDKPLRKLRTEARVTCPECGADFDVDATDVYRGIDDLFRNL